MKTLTVTVSYDETNEVSMNKAIDTLEDCAMRIAYEIDDLLADEYEESLEDLLDSDCEEDDEDCEWEPDYDECASCPHRDECDLLEDDDEDEDEEDDLSYMVCDALDEASAFLKGVLENAKSRVSDEVLEACKNEIEAIEDMLDMSDEDFYEATEKAAREIEDVDKDKIVTAIVTAFDVSLSEISLLFGMLNKPFTALSYFILNGCNVVTGAKDDPDLCARLEAEFAEKGYLRV